MDVNRRGEKNSRKSLEKIFAKQQVSLFDATTNTKIYSDFVTIVCGRGKIVQRCVRDEALAAIVSVFPALFRIAVAIFVILIGQPKFIIVCVIVAISIWNLVTERLNFL